MQLNDQQKQAVAAWVEQGDGLQDIQRKLASEFGLTLTYMDTRFLVIELGLAVKDRSKPAASPKADLAGRNGRGEPETGGDALDDEGMEEGGSGIGGGVSVSVDRIMKPGSLVSGSVTFSDGVTGEWGLDQFGRLALSAAKPGYKPSPEDLRAFQEELRAVLQRKGF